MDGINCYEMGRPAVRLPSYPLRWGTGGAGDGGDAESRDGKRALPLANCMTKACIARMSRGLCIARNCLVHA
ncbi:hypothetical protein D9M68_664410 [compost metagenome]